MTNPLVGKPSTIHWFYVEQSSTLTVSRPRLLAQRASRWSIGARTLGTEMRFELRIIALLTTLSIGGTLAAPVLHDRPLLLMALSPRFVFVALAAAHAPLPLFVVVGLVRLSVADPINYAIGRRLGPQGCSTRLINRVPRSRPAAAVLVLLRPSGLVMMYAGSIGLRGRLVAALDMLSTTVYLIVLHVGIQRAFG